MENLKVVNMVVAGDIPPPNGVEIDLYSLAILSEDFPGVEIEYEPEQFPGAMIKVYNGGRKRTALLFHTGKIVIAGIQSIQEAQEIYNMVRRIVEKCEEERMKGVEE